jgi:predicted transcriptional regulator
MPGGDRVCERRKAAALALHYRDQEGLSIAEIARRLGRAEATVKAYLYDPTGEKARAVKARCVGVCRDCGAYTRPRTGKTASTSLPRGLSCGRIQTKLS